MTTIYHELKHTRKISDITGEEVKGYGSTDGSTVWTPLKVDSNGAVYGVGGLVNAVYDYVSESYTGPNLTQAVCRAGGASGDIVATLDFGYTLGKLISITRS